MIIILRKPKEIQERDRLEAENRKRGRNGQAQLVIHENCACGCGAQVPTNMRDGFLRFFVNEDHYQAMVKRTNDRIAAMQRDNVRQ
jgi:hypothetical protein